MLGDIKAAEQVYIACGYTDMRKSIDGLAALVREQFRINPFSPLPLAKQLSMQGTKNHIWKTIF